MGMVSLHMEMGGDAHPGEGVSSLWDGEFTGGGTTHIPGDFIHGNGGKQ